MAIRNIANNRNVFKDQTISFDTSVDAGFVAGTTTLTFAHTCSGINRILFVGIWGDILNDKITTTTYAGRRMTLVNKVLEPAGGRWTYLFSLIAPPLGANNVIATASSAISIAGMSASYNGVLQRNTIDTNSVATITTTTSITSTLTTLDNGDWTFLVGRNGIGLAAAGAGSTLRQSSSNGLSLFDSGTTLSIAGAYNMTITGATASWATVMTAITAARRRFRGSRRTSLLRRTT